MNNLKNTHCYLAGNLENSKDSISWRQSATEKLKEFKVVALDPTIQCFTNQLSENSESIKNLKKLLKDKQYEQVHTFMQKIIRRDLRMCDRADFLIVNLEPLKATYGTTHEIVIASLQRKPVFFRLDDKSQMPLWYCGLINFDLVFETWEELFIKLKEINESSDDQLDNKFWKIWKEEYR